MIRSEATILVVDDDPIGLRLIYSLLKDQYHLKAANCGETALAIVAKDPALDMILLDIRMPGMDGYEVIRQLKENPQTNDIPVIFLTALTEADEEEKGLRLGATDYITKPINPQILCTRVETHLLAKQARDWLKDQNAALDAEVTRRMKQNDIIQQVTIRALAHLAEVRDPETGDHILRTQKYVAVLARRLKDNPRFSMILSDKNINMIIKSAPLHDIGKVGIPDDILLKPGPLTPEEWKVMETHAEIGAQAIERAERDVAQPVGFLDFAKQIARWHHEKWDGSGYPNQLKADEIPVPVRLMTLADIFDALISDRIYRPAFPPEEVKRMILADKGKHFDPDVVNAFEQEYETFLRIAEHFSERKDRSA